MEQQTNSLDFSTVLAGSVHDMKNSVAMLQGSLSEIEDLVPDSDHEIKNKLDRAKHEGNRINRDLIQLLTIFKLDRMQQHINIDEVNISEFLSDIIIEHLPLLKSRGIQLSQQCDNSLFGYFDEELVSNVMNTIIHNAYQYTGDKILLKADSTNGYLELSVLDDGHGYPDNLLTCPTPEKTLTNFGNGSTGLGLYFSSKIAAAHQSKGKTGFIKVTNDNDPQSIMTGGCFSLFLP